MPKKTLARGGKGAVKNINIAVDEHMHRLFRMQAAKEGITLKDFIVRSAAAAVSPDLFGADAARKKGGAPGKK